QIVLRHLIRDFDVALVRPTLSHVRLFVVDRTNGRTRDVRQRNMADELARDRIDAACGNLVIRELRPSAAVGVAGQRIVNAGRRRTEVAITERGLRHVTLCKAAAIVARPYEIAKKEQFIAFEWSAEREARLQVLRV